MTEVPHNGSGTKPPLKIETPRALADIGYNSKLATDQGTSSEDEALEAQEFHSEDARTAIGISISREQTRLSSPTTPAAEKASKIERAGGFFGGLGGADATLKEEPEEDDHIDDDEIEDADIGLAQGRLFESSLKPDIPERSSLRNDIRLQQESSKRKSSLFDGIFNRKRASSGSEVASEGWQKTLLSSLPSLPSMPKRFSIPSPFSTTHDARRETNETPQVLESSRNQTGISGDGTLSEVRKSQSNDQLPSLDRRVSSREANEALSPSLRPTRSRSTLLRRSTSDHSLTTLRTLSIAASLGDDSRFQDVHNQVNSRFKAIRDSLQDSNIKLPSIPNLSVSSFTPDFIRERSSSLSKQSGTVGSQSPIRKDSTKPYAKPVDPITRQARGTRSAVHDAASGKALNNPHFNHAVQHLDGDLVVLGGYRGSILRSAHPPHRQLWVPIKVGLNIRKVNLEVGLEQEDDERATDHIVPDGMLSHIGPVDISRRLFKRLRASENFRNGRLRVHDYGYDWRLQPLFLSAQLIRFLESLPCNKAGVPKERRGATVVAHSLGGLITRHAVNERPDLFRGVVYAGVPTTCVNVLGPLRNGDEVLLSNRVLTAQVNFTIRTSYALLPLDGRCFIDKDTNEHYPVDFFDPQNWIDYRLSPCVARPLPPLNTQPKPSGITGYVSSMTGALPLPGRKGSLRSKIPGSISDAIMTRGTAEPDMADSNAGDSDAVMANENIDTNEADVTVRTAVTLPREKAFAYLERTLADVKRFKQALGFIPAHAESNSYPPIAVIYGKSTPTVFGAKVNGREGIKHADAYDDLAFASGDGVVLARAAMVPKGYTTAKNGIVASDRGHVTLLGDLEAVGKCLDAVIRARRKGVGIGHD